MLLSMALIQTYRDADHRSPVMALWREVFGYETAHNETGLALDKKLAVADGLLFVATHEAGAVLGTVMAGYDGHRGMLYSVAVAQNARGQGIGTALVRHAEDALSKRGCLKINLQLLASNHATAGFYLRLGYAVEPRISMGKVLSENLPGSSRI
jgi:ribosomal protein S18 acetylase RimI-like enzyme